jgi:cyanophycinase-like exopeptidase
VTTSTPGLIALLGSGETAPASGAVYELLAQRVGSPLHVAVLETPAGFQPNSALVAGKVADFLQVRLQNYRPTLEVLPARQRYTAFSPDDPATTEGLRRANLIFLGPGSPTYTARQLGGSLAWQRLIARQRHGAALVAASAAAIALGAFTLPVYEIYKVGLELHWQPGLNLFAPYGLQLLIVPHWNNSEGGAELDTSRCYMGQARFARLLAMLPPGLCTVGIDEHTGLVFDLAAAQCRVLGRGGVTLLRNGQEQHFPRNSSFAMHELGPFRMPPLDEGLPAEVWQAMADGPAAEPAPPVAPPEVLALAEARQAARERRDWGAADAARNQLAALGWHVRDTPDGPVVEALG